MATPKIFVSSTCYDLKEIRDNLYEFIDSLGYTPVFSDKNDVFYHPDLHTHDACIKEIENCQIFILIVGGRFGGKYKFDTSKSIVNAEYTAAKELNLPIFTFVKDDVYANHLVYEKNKDSEHAGKINYPAISDQKYAKNIFEFINEVRKADINNSLIEFEFGRDIKLALKKQLAGMFYDFLWNRKRDIDREKINKSLATLTTIGKKTEEILENIFRKVEPTKSEEVLRKIDNEINAKKFWIAVTSALKFHLRRRTIEEKKALVHIESGENWEQYLLRQFDTFEIAEFESSEYGSVFVLKENLNGFGIYTRVKKDGNPVPESAEWLSAVEIGFSCFAQLTEEQRIKIIEEITL